MLTIYGRKAVLEALQHDLDIYCVHFASSNKNAEILDEIQHLAKQRNIEIKHHDKQALSRISRNSRQDQGVAADVFCPNYQRAEDYLTESHKQTGQQLIALENITNPQNVGMIIRSICAGNIGGVIIPKQGTAEIGPLVIKASAGTVFKARVLRCNTLVETLPQFKDLGFQICTLSAHAQDSLFDNVDRQARVFVLGNESTGVSKTIEKLADKQYCIPMNNGVESLNVAVTAALIAFQQSLCSR